MCVKSNSFQPIFVIYLILNACFAEIQLIDEDFVGPIVSDEGWYCWNVDSCQKTYCGGSAIFGGYNGFDYHTQIFKTFELLPPHYQIGIRFKFWRIDQWDLNDQFTIYVDNTLVHKYIYSDIDSSSNICGSNDYDSVIQFDLIVDHFSTSSIILMTTLNGGWWGISEFRQYVLKCPFGCGSCNLYYCFNQVLFLELFNKRLFTIQNLQGWYHSGNQITDINSNWCGFDSQYSPGDYLTKSFILGNHFAVSFQLKVAIFYAINTKVNVEIDDNIISTSELNLQVPTYIDDGCGKILILGQINIFQQEHTNNVLTIKIEVVLSNYYDSRVRFGIRDFQLFIKPDLDTYSNINSFDEFFTSQLSCIYGCSNCIKGICFQCQEGWEYIIQIKNCVPLWGDSIILQYEKCDIGNFIPIDGCQLFKFECSQDCLKCQFGQCLEYQQSIIQMKSDCIFDPTNLNEYKLKESSFDPYFINFIDQSYYDNFLNLRQSQQTIGIVQICNLKELAIFGFHIQNNLQIQNCDKQLFDQCLKCQLFYQLSFNKQKCIPYCNDGIKLLDEICDDNNKIQFDGCYKCQESCQLECQICIQAYCYECQDGWKLLDHRCYPQCGDNKVAKLSSEQCDDGNYEPNDGCYECRFECDENCLICASKDFCSQCLVYFEEIKSKCMPICGDGFVVPLLEECDDKNQTPFDGCYQCQFQCEEKCDKCDKGNCIECQKGYQVDENQKCLLIKSGQVEDEKGDEQQQICGDTIRQQNEGCDDGNDYSYDGCSQSCQVEDSWQCNEEIPNKCYRNTQFFLTFLNKTYDNQYVNLTFSQKVKWMGAFSNFTQAILTEIKGVETKIFITPITQIDKQKSNDPVYQLNIKILTSTSIPPILVISIQDGIVDEYDFNLALTSQELKLKTAIILSNSQIEIANKFSKMGNYIMIGLGCNSVLMLLLGDPQSSLAIFDILQFQSYLRFINIEFPQNIQIYFESSDFVTLTPVLVKLNIFDLFNNLFGYEHLDSIGKFQQYQLNADLLTNIYGLITQIILFFWLFIFLIVYRKFFFHKCFSIKQIDYVRLAKSTAIESLIIKLYNINKKFLQLSNLYTKKGLLQLFYANNWDLLFKVILYIVSNTQSGYRSLFSNCICFGYIVLLFFLLIQHFRKQNQKVVIAELRSEQYEGIVLLKKFLFLIVLEGMQYNSLYQCTLLAVILFGYLLFITLIRFQSSSLDLFVIYLLEAPIIIFTLLSLFYCSDFQNKLDGDGKIQLAFYQIGFLIFGLLGPLIRSSIQFYLKIKNYILEMRQPKTSSAINIFTVANK
ncbi:unnamed protein product [Paramecium sonneborni]|uniref:Uncharacterized protein n=1 Tax=Paramecium sonneborni TaxID=65129 RepID=A0A8S1NTX0_9CILI|nr:unnamed protein product [Paramecium sonneborni]